MDQKMTICAVSTPPGIGGIAVIRVSGPEALSIVQKIWEGADLISTKSHTAHLGTVRHADGTDLDQCVATIFRAPASYTGEDVVELSVHGSIYVQRTLIEALTNAGARLAEPGEFTRRAFTAGKIDLVQAEGVADILAARSRFAHKMAMNQLRGGISHQIQELQNQLLELASLLELELDFSEEHVEFADRSHLIQIATQVNQHVGQLHKSYATGAAIKDGIPVAIAGVTNAGKSSLLNALLKDDRAIVSNIHGTTRDVIEDTLIVGQHMFRIMDTAGLRQTNDTIEQAGIERTHRAISRALITILVIDHTQPHDSANAQTINSLSPESRLIVVVNKNDIPIEGDQLPKIRQALPHGTPLLTLSAKTGQGIDDLLNAISQTADDITQHAGDNLIANLRQAQTLQEAAIHSLEVVQGLRDNLPPELVAQSLRLTIADLSSLTGQISSTQILTTIFSRFCIGK